MGCLISLAIHAKKLKKVSKPDALVAHPPQSARHEINGHLSRQIRDLESLSPPIDIYDTKVT